MGPDNCMADDNSEMHTSTAGAMIANRLREVYRELKSRRPPPLCGKDQTLVLHPRWEREIYVQLDISPADIMAHSKMESLLRCQVMFSNLIPQDKVWIVDTDKLPDALSRDLAQFFSGLYSSQE